MTSPSPAASPAPSRLNLAALLAVIVLVDLSFGRIFAKLLPSDGDMLPSAVLAALRWGTRFVGQLAAVLGWLLLVFMLATLARRNYYRRSTRVSLLFIGSVFSALVGVGLFARIPGALLLHLYLSFLFLAGSAILAILASRAPSGERLGVVILLLPIAAHFGLSLNDRFATFFGWSRQSDLIPYVDSAVLVGAAAAAGLFRPRRHHYAAPIAIAIVFAGLAATLVLTHWDIAQRIALNGFGLELPMQLGSALVYCVGLGTLVYAITINLLGEPRDQLRAYGLCILVANGVQLYWPSQLGIAMVGLFCLLEAAARPDDAGWSRDAQEASLRTAAVAAGAAQVTFNGEPGDESARLVGARDDQPVEVIVEWRGGRIENIEIALGGAPPRDPPFTLEARGTSNGPRADAPRLHFDDEALEQEFVCHDRKSVAATILDPLTQAKLRIDCRGWLAVWPQRGVRYRASRLSGRPDALASTVEMVVAVWERVK